MLKYLTPQIVVLIGFSFLLREVLTFTTLIFTTIGIMLVLLNYRPNKLIRNALALTVFGSYWVTYGKIIDPEVGLNFLTSIVVLKILEKETIRDRYMIFFGLLLLISAGSLFERTLTYVFFFGICFLFLIRDFYRDLGQRWRLKDLTLALIWVLPLTFILFFFVPRLLNPIPFQQNSMTPGEIGYTPDVNISEIESLEGNQSQVFQVSVSKKLGQKDLYWRGNTLSFNDGWNWKEMLQDKENGDLLLGHTQGPDEILQRFRLNIRSEYFFALDYPSVLAQGKDFFSFGVRTKSMPQKRWEWIQRYIVFSQIKNDQSFESVSRNYLQVPLPKKLKNRLNHEIKGTTLTEITKSLQEYIVREKFSYSLSPGKSVSLNEFLERKIGLCSHYASMTALTLRIKGIPSRLVSGFMGGSYNDYANFYAITQNDAHVWVEAFSDGKWQRLDPTEWIAPERVQLGGEAFMQNVREGTFQKTTQFQIPKLLRDLKLWFGQWDFKFYQWLEQMDYQTQDAIFKKFKFKREWLFSIIPLIMLVFMLIYMWYLSSKKISSDRSFYHELWNLFYKKLEKKGISHSRTSFLATEMEIKKQSDEKVKEVWKELSEVSFTTKEILPGPLKKKIKSL